MERRHGPTVLVMGRQNLPVLDRQTYAAASGVQRGGYVLWESLDDSEAILIGTGSEVPIALDAGKILEEKGIRARVVSLPTWTLFDAQSSEYRNSVLPSEIKARVSIEAGTTMGWERYLGFDGVAMGIPHFGAPAPAGVLYEKFGPTARRMAGEAEYLVMQGDR